MGGITKEFQEILDRDFPKVVIRRENDLWKVLHRERELVYLGEGLSATQDRMVWVSTWKGVDPRFSFRPMLRWLWGCKKDYAAQRRKIEAENELMRAVDGYKSIDRQVAEAQDADQAQAGDMVEDAIMQGMTGVNWTRNAKVGLGGPCQ